MVKEQLVQLVRNNRLSHALLFLGKEGSGALSLALAFSQYIVCDSASRDSRNNDAALFSQEILPVAVKELNTDSCGICPACLKASQYIHPDIHYSFPVINKKSGEKPVSNDFIVQWREFLDAQPYGNVYDWLQFIGAENKQGNITAEECNNINKKLSLKPFESKYKILVMWMPEFLGKEGNKLLKLIEEPPPDTLFIFVAENEGAILPTILSRTQLIKIHPLSDQEVEQALINNEGRSENKARQIAAVAEGNYHEALQLLQHSEDDWQGILRDWLNAIIKTGPAAQIKWVEETSKLGREKQKQFLRYFIHLLEQSVRLRILDDHIFSLESGTRSVHAHMPENEKDFAMRLNNICSLSAQKSIIEELDRATWYIERNAHGKLLFHALTIRLYHIIKDNSLILIS